MSTLLLGFDFKPPDDVINIVVVETLVVHDRLYTFANPVKTEARRWIVSVFIKPTFING